MTSPVRVCRERCCVDGCVSQHLALGYCSMHYNRLKSGVPMDCTADRRMHGRWLRKASTARTGTAKCTGAAYRKEHH